MERRCGVGHDRGRRWLVSRLHADLPRRQQEADLRGKWASKYTSWTKSSFKSPAECKACGTESACYICAYMSNARCAGASTTWVKSALSKVKCSRYKLPCKDVYR